MSNDVIRKSGSSGSLPLVFFFRCKFTVWKAVAINDTKIGRRCEVQICPPRPLMSGEY